MKLLFVTPYVPNLIRVRPYQLLRALVDRGHQITLLTVSADAAEARAAQELAALGLEVRTYPLPRWRSGLNSALALPSRTPLQAVYAWQPQLAADLVELARRGGYAAVHFEHLRAARYGLHLHAALGVTADRPPLVWDSVDSITHLFRQTAQRGHSLPSRLMARFELPRTAPYEAALLRAFDAVTVTSAADRQAFLDLDGAAAAAEVTVIPNGVDLTYFRPDPAVARRPAELVLSGKMSYHANVTMALQFVTEVLPRVWARRPEVKLWIVGKDPRRSVLALGADPRVQVTGTVDHLPPYLQAAALAVAPIAYGAGIQNKVLEAMACGAPVVASGAAVAALQAVGGEEVVVADGAEATAAAVLRLLDDAAERQRLGAAGRAYVERWHRWDGAAAQLEALYAAAPRPQGGR
jgi:glycosyltransferase involved in cell wall biosynthesis